MKGGGTARAVKELVRYRLKSFARGGGRESYHTNDTPRTAARSSGTVDGHRCSAVGSSAVQPGV